MSDLQIDFNVSKESTKRTNQHLDNHKIDIVVLQIKSADKKARQNYVHD